MDMEIMDELRTGKKKKTERHSQIEVHEKKVMQLIEKMAIINK